MSFFARLFGTRGVERQRQRVLQREAAASGGMTPGQIGVLVEVNSTIAAADAKASRRLLRKQHRLDAADFAAVLAGQRLDATRADPIWRGHRRAASNGASDRRTEVFHEDFDPHRPLITSRVLTVVEIIFIVVEVFFWYSIFDDIVEPGTPWYDPSKVGAALLAVFIPVVGVATARVVGPLGHRWLAGYPGVGRKDRIGAVFAAIAFVLALVAVGWLINFRFDEETAPIGSLPPPALPMAAVFVAVLLADAAARVFLVSEIREQTQERSRVFDRLVVAKTKADLAHHRAWEDLRAEVQTHLDAIERVVAVGARMIADARAVPPQYATPQYLPPVYAPPQYGQWPQTQAPEVAQQQPVPPTEQLPAGPGAEPRATAADAQPAPPPDAVQATENAPTQQLPATQPPTALGPYPVTPVPPAVGDPRSAHLGSWAENGTRDGLTGLPSTEPLTLFGTGMAIGPLRRIEDAIEHLSRCRPEDSASAARRITELRERLFHLEPFGPRGTAVTPTQPLPARDPADPIDPMPVNGYQPPAPAPAPEQRP
ncbi:hypothetical protein [Cryptosporangium aurantiacum]|uniref:Uncharacterized protein n=1 Tax=Cryptosporangium aurantiacum TaxID=134849 RepID=A0A1M7RE71_9ACTN|nr:hypothetical protein [Cryptosporangium aurantiacum]SHN44439.1 hypothetical protein SAMN05443668_110210 [Cryptosporangium aurantiacum]